MKKSLLAALMSTALFTPWAAQAQESYLKFGVGQGQYKAGGSSESQTAVSLAFGQSLGQNWGYELGYMNFGKLSDSGTEGTETANVSFRTQSIYAAAVGTLPLGDSFSLFGKLGVAVNYTKVRASFAETSIPGGGFSRSESETKTKPMIGIGAAYNFSKQLAATAEYQYFGEVVDGMKADAWTLGLKYGF